VSEPQPGDPATKAAPLSVPARLQRGLEALYRVDTQLDVESFLIDEQARRQTGVARAPREQLLVSQRGDDEVRIGLFLDERALANLEANDPAAGLDQRNFDDFCLVVEGVSHFIYVALAAAGERSVSGLELELQAEVDKFACCLLLSGAGTPANGNSRAGDDAGARTLRRKLYDEVCYADDLDSDEADRYRVANLEARRYAETLSRTFLARDRVSDMLAELRRFYRLGLHGKLGHIARLAA